MTDFKKMKFRVGSEVMSKCIQEKLFSLGYIWQDSCLANVAHTKEPFLYTDKKGGKLSFGTTEGFFEDATGLFGYEEHYLNVDGELIPGNGEFEEPASVNCDPTAPFLEDVPQEPPQGDKANPKAAIGAKALPMTMLSPLACAMGALGKYNGMQKYGGANFIGTKVVMSIYLDAIRRHLDKIIMGEEFDEADGVPHFGAIIANCDIIVSAQAAGTLIDDRLRCDGQREAIKALTPIVASLQELHKERKPYHYLMANKEADSGGS